MSLCVAGVSLHWPPLGLRRLSPESHDDGCMHLLGWETGPEASG